MSDNLNAKAVYDWIKAGLHDRFNLDDDKASEQETIDEIKRSIEFKGPNLWILIFAIMVASVGLNVNSAAVVIGAMLISPLMGPIMGIGLGVGILDIDLLVRSLRNMLIAVVISVLTSALYFWISPLNDAQSELLARTSPTLWDVLIGLFGGLAGIVAGSRREKSNAIPGVAIATALMPPLCTAGYGLATGQYNYFFGAFYLFFINSVFISLSTYFVVRVLGFKRKEIVDPTREIQIKRFIYLFVILTVIPSTYTAYQVVVENVFNRRVQNFINQEFNFRDTKVIAKEVTYGDSAVIDVTLFGEPLSDEMIDLIKGRMAFHHIHSTRLNIRQNSSDSQDQPVLDYELINQQMRAGIIEDLYTRNEELIRTKKEKIDFLEAQLFEIRKDDFLGQEISTELHAINPDVLEFSISKTVLTNWVDSFSQDTTQIAYLRFAKKPTKADVGRIEDWLKVRTDSDKVKVIVED